MSKVTEQKKRKALREQVEAMSATKTAKAAKAKVAVDKVDASEVARRLVVVKLIHHSWSGKVQAPDVSDEITTAKDAAKDSVETSLRLVPKRDRAEVGRTQSQVDRFWKRSTVPWGDGGYRVMVAARFPNFDKQMSDLMGAYGKARDTFLERIETIKDNRRKEMKGLWREDLFPSRVKIAGRMGVDIRTMAVSDPNDIRLVGATPEMEQRMRADAMAEIADKVKGAVDEVIALLKGVVNDAIERYKESEDKNPQWASFHKRVKDTCARLRDLNILNDKALEDAIVTVENVLTKRDANVLRESRRAIGEAKKETEAVAAMLDALL